MLAEADGVRLHPASLDMDLEELSRLVLPELRRRGLLRPPLQDATFRDQLGLARPGQPLRRRIAAPPSPPETKEKTMSTAHRAKSDVFTPSGQLQLGVFFQGVNSGTIWKAAESGSQTDFESFRRIAQTAERGLFAAFFLGEGLRLREHLGRPHALDVAGRPDAQTMLAALAAVTTNIGLVATQNTTYNDPADLAHRLVLPGPALRRPRRLEHRHHGQRLDRRQLPPRRLPGPRGPVQPCRGVRGNRQADLGLVGRPPSAGPRRGRGAATTASTTPWTSRRGCRAAPSTGRCCSRPGIRPEGRDFAARQADVIFSAHPQARRRPGVPPATSWSARSAAGRGANDVKIMPASEFILAATPQEAREKKAWVRSLQIGPQQAIAYLEQFWGRELSGLRSRRPAAGDRPRGGGDLRNPRQRLPRRQGPPAGGPVAGRGQGEGPVHPPVRLGQDQPRIDATFTGSYTEVADRLAEYARTGAVDGFNISPWLIPTGLDDIVNHLVPELQERGVYPTEYAGSTLRENLGLETPVRTADEAAEAVRA